MIRSLVVITSLLATIPAGAQPVGTRGAQNSLNWDIFQKLYPPRAVAAREEGAVGFTVTLDHNGDVMGCQVTHSSGHPLLDEETCQLITLNAKFTRDPALGPSEAKTHEGMIAWKLPASTTVFTQPMPVAPDAAPERMICKKALRIGTLAAYERACMTRTQWARQSDEEKQVYDEM